MFPGANLVVAEGFSMIPVPQTSNPLGLTVLFKDGEFSFSPVNRSAIDGLAALAGTQLGGVTGARNAGGVAIFVKLPGNVDSTVGSRGGFVGRSLIGSAAGEVPIFLMAPRGFASNPVLLVIEATGSVGPGFVRGKIDEIQFPGR